MEISRSLAILLLIILLILIGSSVIYKDNFAVITGIIENGKATINYPNGFNSTNCIVTSVMFKRQGLPDSRGYTTGSTLSTADGTTGSLPATVELRSSGIVINSRIIYISSSGTITAGDINFNIDYRIVLMKI